MARTMGLFNTISCHCLGWGKEFSESVSILYMFVIRIVTVCFLISLLVAVNCSYLIFIFCASNSPLQLPHGEGEWEEERVERCLGFGGNTELGNTLPKLQQVFKECDSIYPYLKNLNLKLVAGTQVAWLHILENSGG